MWSICVWFKLQTIVPQTSDFYNRTSSGGFTTLDLVTSIGIDHMPPNQMSDVLNYGAICFRAIFMSHQQSKAHHIVGQQLAIWTCVAILSSGIVGSAGTGLGESPGRFLGWVHTPSVDYHTPPLTHHEELVSVSYPIFCSV